MLAAFGVLPETRLTVYRSKLLKFAAFPTVFLLVLGFFVARTYLLEPIDNGVVEQKVCVDYDYDEGGSRCLGEESVYRSLDEVMQGHVSGAITLGIIGGTAWAIGSPVGVKQAEDDIARREEIRGR